MNGQPVIYVVAILVVFHGMLKRLNYLRNTKEEVVEVYKIMGIEKKKIATFHSQ